MGAPTCDAPLLCADELSMLPECMTSRNLTLAET